MLENFESKMHKAKADKQISKLWKIRNLKKTSHQLTLIARLTGNSTVFLYVVGNTYRDPLFVLKNKNEAQRFDCYPGFFRSG